ncbi:MAG: hypothetical protein M3512_04750 [Bacteroidota bacterium]|nr:hypothetical protein [Bacteroidota bacterium]
MDIKKLDAALLEIIEKKNQLTKLDYSDLTYDTIEEELHDLEDDFIEEYGSFLDDALHVVHDEYCPDNDVLLPIAYLANKYVENGKREDGSPIFSAAPNEGVIVDVDDFPEKVCRLVFEPGPLRLIMRVDKGKSIEVWKAES